MAVDNSWITKGKIRKIDIIPTNSNKENKVTNEWRDNLILFSHHIFFLPPSCIHSMQCQTES